MTPPGVLAEERWLRNQQVTVTTVFVVFTGFAFVIPFLPLYVRQLGVQDTQSVALWSGLLIGVSPLLAGLLAPVWGRLADRYGHKRMALRALASYVLLLALSAAVTSVEQLLALRVGVGLFGGIGPLGLAMATARAPREHTGRAVGAVQSAQILSAAVGPLAGGLLADLIGIRATFLLTAAVCLGALWLVARHYEEAAPAAAAASAEPRAPASGLLRQARVLGLLVVLFLVNFVGRSFTPILPLHLQELGVPLSRLAFSTGALISVYSVAAAASAGVLGRAARNRRPQVLLVMSLIGGALTVVPMAFVGSFPALLALALALGLASGGCLTLCYTIGGLMVPSAGRATAFGFFSGAALFGGAVSPTAAGLVAHWDLRGIYLLDGAVFLLLAIALAPTSGRVPASAEASPAADGGVASGG